MICFFSCIIFSSHFGNDLLPNLRLYLSNSLTLLCSLSILPLLFNPSAIPSFLLYWLFQRRAFGSLRFCPLLHSSRHSSRLSSSLSLSLSLTRFSAILIALSLAFHWQPKSLPLFLNPFSSLISLRCPSVFLEMNSSVSLKWYLRLSLDSRSSLCFDCSHFLSFSPFHLPLYFSPSRSLVCAFTPAQPLSHSLSHSRSIVLSHILFFLSPSSYLLSSLPLTVIKAYLPSGSNHEPVHTTKWYVEVKWLV